MTTELAEGQVFDLHGELFLIRRVESAFLLLERLDPHGAATDEVRWVFRGSFDAAVRVL